MSSCSGSPTWAREKCTKQKSVLREPPADWVSESYLWNVLQEASNADGLREHSSRLTQVCTVSDENR